MAELYKNKLHEKTLFSPRWQDNSTRQAETSKHLSLNPGLKERVARTITPKSIWMLLALIAFAAARIHAQYDLKGLYKKYNALSDPHRNMYYRSTPGKTPEEGAFLKPFIGRKGEPGSVFDLQATVWVKPNRTQDEWREKPDTPIFTGIVFKGATLQDKRLQAQIQLQIPTQVFQNPDLGETDLRASFVLIPQSPSLLDKAVGFETINYVDMNIRPVRPLGEGIRPRHDIPSSYGISTPLIGFYYTPFTCSSSATQEEYDATPSSGSTTNEPAGVTTHKRRRRRYHSHPHVITRTYLTVADTNVLYNATAYDKMHDLLGQAKQVCAERDLGPSICKRNFHTFGNFETKIRIQSEDEESGYSWTYGPFMSVIENAWGPMDLVPAPANNCPSPGVGSVPVRAHDDGELMNVTWHITFSGRTPLKLGYTDILTKGGTPIDMSKTVEEQLSLHLQIAGRQGVIGHPYSDNFHPRRGLVLDFLSTRLQTVNSIVTTHYFLTRSTTVGLSRFGIILRGASPLLNHFITAVIYANHHRYEPFTLVGFIEFIMRTASHLTAILALKVISRTRLHWNRRGAFKVLPRIVCAPPNHAERASLHIESHITIPVIIGTIFLWDVVQYFFPLSDIYIVQPRNVTKPVANLILLQQYHTYIAKYFLNPGELLSISLQIIHNYRSKTFAGTHKIAALALSVSSICAAAIKSPMIIGRIGHEKEVQPGYDADSLLALSLQLIFGFQALLFPVVSQVEEVVE